MSTDTYADPTNTATHYTYLGNVYWGTPFEGFCGSTRGLFTSTAAQVSCSQCRDEMADVGRVVTFEVPAFA